MYVYMYVCMYAVCMYVYIYIFTYVYLYSSYIFPIDQSIDLSIYLHTYIIGRDGKRSNCVIFADLSLVPSLLPAKCSAEQTRHKTQALKALYQYALRCNSCRVRQVKPRFTRFTSTTVQILTLYLHAPRCNSCTAIRCNSCRAPAPRVLWRALDRQEKGAGMRHVRCLCARSAASC